MSSHKHLTVTSKTQEDLTIIKTYPTTTKPNKHTKDVYVRDFSRKQRVCMHLTEGQHVYIREF
jgi:hypothetical protein